MRSQDKLGILWSADGERLADLQVAPPLTITYVYVCMYVCIYIYIYIYHR